MRIIKTLKGEKSYIQGETARVSFGSDLGASYEVCRIILLEPERWRVDRIRVGGADVAWLQVSPNSMAIVGEPIMWPNERIEVFAMCLSPGALHLAIFLRKF